MNHINNSSSPPRFAALLAGAALLGLISQSALALTASGTVISNNATLTYNVGGVDPTGGLGVSAAAPATFTVDNKVITLVANDGVGTTVVAGALAQAVKFSVTNNGNTAQSYNLTASLGTNGFTNAITSGYTIYYDTDASGTFNAGDALYVDGAYTLNPATSMTIFVVADIPAPNTNGQTSTVNLVATATTAGGAVPVTNSATNTAGVDIVLADAAGTAAGDIAYDGKHSALNTYTISSGSVTITKTATLLCDPIVGDTTAAPNAPHNIPGAVVRYAITIANAGASSVGLASLSDPLVAGLAADTKLIDGIGTAAPLTTCASATGTSLSASGFAAVTGAGVGPGTFVLNDATTAGATATAGPGGTVSINFTTLATTTAGGVLLAPSVAPETGASLPAGTYVTVFFNAVIQ